MTTSPSPLPSPSPPAPPSPSPPPPASPSPVYDTIGQGYVAHRRPDPRWAALVAEQIGDAQVVVNIGAGTGSYEPTGRDVVAVEPSQVMVEQRPVDAAPALRASASALPLRAGCADVALAVLTVHHWDDWATGLAEMCRVAPRRIVVGIEFTMESSFWLLDEYLPEVADHSRTSVPDAGVIADAIGAGHAQTVPLLVPADMQDGILGAYWRRPEAYLDPAVRANCSGLALADPSVIARGIGALERDLASGEWHERHADLLGRDSVDLGYRLIVAGPR